MTDDMSTEILRRLADLEERWLKLNDVRTELSVKDYTKALSALMGDALALQEDMADEDIPLAGPETSPGPASQ